MRSADETVVVFPHSPSQVKVPLFTVAGCAVSFAFCAAIVALSLTPDGGELSIDQTDVWRALGWTSLAVLWLFQAYVATRRLRFVRKNPFLRLTPQGIEPPKVRKGKTNLIPWNDVDQVLIKRWSVVLMRLDGSKDSISLFDCDIPERKKIKSAILEWWDTWHNRN